MNASEKFEYAKLLLKTLKHMQGQHNQKAHGFRFGATPSLSRARQLRDEGLWRKYAGRARQLAGKPARASGGNEVDGQMNRILARMPVRGGGAKTKREQSLELELRGHLARVAAFRARGQTLEAALARISATATMIDLAAEREGVGFIPPVVGFY